MSPFNGQITQATYDGGLPGNSTIHSAPVDALRSWQSPFNCSQKAPAHTPPQTEHFADLGTEGGRGEGPYLRNSRSSIFCLAGILGSGQG